jgi:DNA (cytosine-5)-methyltransferase 1
MIPVVDIFAGPGGLGEGFSALRWRREKVFKIVLSIEKDKAARETLRLRSFFRQFPNGAPEVYYQFLRGAISIEELYLRYPEEIARADDEAWLAELGKPELFPISRIDERIAKALAGADNWVLIGGPPCQAYSLVGRARMAREPEKHKRDHRHFLYQEYLRILAKHRPPVFVMENVKGILSSKLEGNLIINRILSDLRQPREMNGDAKGPEGGPSVEYKLHPFTHYESDRSLFEQDDPDPSRFIIQAERHGIPQARHRLIVLGVRSDLAGMPGPVRNGEEAVGMWKVIGDLPRIRSRLSQRTDCADAWLKAVKEVTEAAVLGADGIDTDIWRAIRKTARRLNNTLQTGGEFLPSDTAAKWQHAWYHDPRLRGACNHSARAHMKEDLWRYFFAACFATIRRKSPLLTDFPSSLLPKHKNATPSEEEDEIDFADRFRVQLKHQPATTVTAHIAKDGHYFIHPDPLQCRSFTVREAARLQTFPDNFFFVGPRTEQYKQVGNAVPPLLARKLATVVHRLIREKVEA